MDVRELPPQAAVIGRVAHELRAGQVRALAATWPETDVAAAAATLPWTHVTVLLSQVDDPTNGPGTPAGPDLAAWRLG